MKEYAFKLYVAGKTPRADHAISNFQRLCDERLPDCHEIEVIDVLEHPELADEAKILATPTVVRVRPPPSRRVVGDLSNSSKVVQGLGLVLSNPA